MFGAKAHEERQPGREEELTERTGTMEDMEGVEAVEDVEGATHELGRCD